MSKDNCGCLQILKKDEIISSELELKINETYTIGTHSRNDIRLKVQTLVPEYSIIDTKHNGLVAFSSHNVIDCKINDIPFKGIKYLEPGDIVSIMGKRFRYDKSFFTEKDFKMIQSKNKNLCSKQLLKIKINRRRTMMVKNNVNKTSVSMKGSMTPMPKRGRNIYSQFLEEDIENHPVTPSRNNTISVSTPRMKKVFNTPLSIVRNKNQKASSFLHYQPIDLEIGNSSSSSRFFGRSKENDGSVSDSFDDGEAPPRSQATLLEDVTDPGLVDDDDEGGESSARAKLKVFSEISPNNLSWRKRSLNNTNTPQLIESTPLNIRMRSSVKQSRERKSRDIAVSHLPIFKNNEFVTQRKSQKITHAPNSRYKSSTSDESDVDAADIITDVNETSTANILKHQSEHSEVAASNSDYLSDTFEFDGVSSGEEMFKPKIRNEDEPSEANCGVKRTRRETKSLDNASLRKSKKAKRARSDTVRLKRRDIFRVDKNNITDVKEEISELLNTSEDAPSTHLHELSDLEGIQQLSGSTCITDNSNNSLDDQDESIIAHQTRATPQNNSRSPIRSSLRLFETSSVHKVSPQDNLKAIKSSSGLRNTSKVEESPQNVMQTTRSSIGLFKTPKPVESPRVHFNIILSTPGITQNPFKDATDNKEASVDAGDVEDVATKTPKFEKLSAKRSRKSNRITSTPKIEESPQSISKVVRRTTKNNYATRSSFGSYVDIEKTPKFEKSPTKSLRKSGNTTGATVAPEIEESSQNISKEVRKTPKMSYPTSNLFSSYVDIEKIATPEVKRSSKVGLRSNVSSAQKLSNTSKIGSFVAEDLTDFSDVEDVATKSPKFEKSPAKSLRKSRITAGATPKIEESSQSISKEERRTPKINYRSRNSSSSYVDIENIAATPEVKRSSGAGLRGNTSSAQKFLETSTIGNFAAEDLTDVSDVEDDATQSPKFEKSPAKSLRKSRNIGAAPATPNIEESPQSISKEERTSKISYRSRNSSNSYVNIEKIAATPEVKRSSGAGLRGNTSSAQKFLETSTIGNFAAEDLTDVSDVEDDATKSPKFEKSPAKSLRKSRIIARAAATPKIEEFSQSISTEERRTPNISCRSRNSSNSYVHIEKIAATPEVKRSSGVGLRGNTSSAQKLLDTSTIGNFAAEDSTDASDIEDVATKTPKFEKSASKSSRMSGNIAAASSKIEESPQSISKAVSRTSKISYRSRNSSNSYVDIEKTPEINRSSEAGLRSNTSSAQKLLDTSTIGNFAAEDLTDASDIEDVATQSPKFEKSPAKSLRKSRNIGAAPATPNIEESPQSISKEERTSKISYRSRNSSNSYVNIEKIAATPEVKRSSGAGLRGNTSSAQKFLETSTIGNFAAEDLTDVSDVEDVATKSPKFEKSPAKKLRKSRIIAGAAATPKIEESSQSISKEERRTTKISYRSRNSSNSYVHIENIATTPEVKRSSGAGLRANTSSAQKFLDTSNIGNFADENSTDASDVGDVATKTPKLEKSASKSSRKSGNIAATSKIEESPQSISKAVSRTSKISSRTRNLSVSFVDIEKIAGTPEVRILSETGLRGNTSSPQKLPDTSKIGNFSDKDWTDASDVENVTMKSPKFEKVPAKSLRKSRNIAGAVETPKIEEFPQNISKAERRTPKIGYRTMNSSSSYVDIEKIAATPEVERSSPTKSRGSIRSAQKLPNISKIGNFDLANDSDVENVAIKTTKFEKTPNKSSRKSGNIAATPKSLRKSRNIAGAIGTSNVEGSPQSISKAVSRTSKISSRTRNSSGNYVDIENIAATPEAKISSEAELRGNISNAQKLPDTSTIGSFAGEDLNDASDIENVAMKSPKLKKSPAKSLRKSRNIAAAPATPNIEESSQNTSKTVTTPKISYCTRNSFDTITPPDVNSSFEVGLSDSIRGAQKLPSTPKSGNFADEDLNNASDVKEVAMEKSLAKDSRNSIRNRTVTPKIEETQKRLTVTRSSSRFLRTPLADESSESNAFRTPKIVASKYSIGDYDDQSDVRDENISRLLRTPKEQKPPMNDLSDVRGLKKLFATPKVQKLPTNNLSDLRGVKTLLGSQKKQNQPVNDLSTIVGVKNLFTTPKPQRSPKNDLTDVRGVKKLMATPKIQKQPDNDLSDLRGVRKLLGSQKKQQKPPVNELSDFVGVKEMFSIAKPPQKAPKNDLSDVEGVKRLLKTPKQQKLPRNDLTNVGGVKKIMATPKLQKPPKNDLTNLSGVKELFSGYEQDETSNDLKLQKTGGDAIDVTEVNFENEENCIADMKKPTPIRAKKQPNKSMDIRSTDEVEDIKVDPFDALTNRKAIRTYKKSTSPRKNPVTEQEVSSLVTEWVEGQNKRLGDELTKSSIANTSSDEGTANERFRTLNDQKKRLLTQTRRNKEDVLGQVEKADVSTSGLEEMTESNVHSPPALRKRPLRQTRRNKRDILGGAKQTGVDKSGLEDISAESTSHSTPNLHKRPLRQTRRNKRDILGQVELTNVIKSGLEEITAEPTSHSTPDLHKRPLRQTRRNKGDILGGAEQTGESKSGLEETTAEPTSHSTPDLHKRTLRQTRRNKRDILGQVEHTNVIKSALEEITAEPTSHSTPDLHKRPLRQTRRNKGDILGGAEQTGESKSGLEETTAEPSSRSTPDVHKRPLRQTRRNKRDILGQVEHTNVIKSALEEITAEPTSHSTPDLHNRPPRQTRRNKADILGGAEQTGESKSGLEEITVEPTSQSTPDLHKRPLRQTRRNKAEMPKTEKIEDDKASTTAKGGAQRRGKTRNKDENAVINENREENRTIDEQEDDLVTVKPVRGGRKIARQLKSQSNTHVNVDETEKKSDSDHDDVVAKYEGRPVRTRRKRVLYSPDAEYAPPTIQIADEVRHKSEDSKKLPAKRGRRNVNSLKLLEEDAGNNEIKSPNTSKQEQKPAVKRTSRKRKSESDPTTSEVNEEEPQIRRSKRTRK